MALHGRIRSWLWKDITGISGGDLPEAETLALDLFDDVKLWAMITNGQISYDDATIAGLQASFEI